MPEELRKSGIEVLGSMPWGTHFCHFYETKQDLLDILVPYFRTGLENNEFCLWVTSNPLTVEKATRALRQAVPDFERYLAKHAIEILPYAHWYLNGKAFRPKRVIDGWHRKLNRALARGYVGMRVNGNEAWLKREIWKDFVEYERELNKSIAGKRIIVLCAYPLRKCEAADILDVARAHDRAITKRGGRWMVVEIPELKQTKEEIKRLNAKLERRVAERTRELAATTQELRQEIACRQSAEQRAESILANISETHILFDRQWRYLYVNEAAANAIGRSCDQILGHTLWELFPDIIGTDLELQYRRAMEERTGTICEFHYVTRDTWWENRFYPTPEGLAVFANEITARKQAEKALRASEERFRELAENIREVFWMSDLKTTRILYVSPAYEKIWGRTCQSVYEKPLSFVESIHPDDREGVLQVLEGQKTRGEFQKEYRVVRPDGSVRWILDRGFPIRNAAGEIVRVAGIAEDITDRKLAEVERERLLRRVQQNRDRLQLMSLWLMDAQETERRHIARELHDEVGQTLTALKLALQMAEKQMETVQKAYLRDAAQRVDELMAQVRNISLDLRPTMLDDLGLLPALLWHFERFTTMTRIRVAFQHSGLENRRFPSEIETGVYRIVQEALTNVARHAGVGEVVVRVWANEDMLGMEVEDHGKGFDAAATLISPISSGLSGMRERVALFGGEFAIESAPGRGTRLRVSLPLHKGEPA